MVMAVCWSMRVQKMPGSWYKLFIDGKQKELPYFGTSKRSLTRFLKKEYDIDLRTDKRIQKNYVEKITRVVQTKGDIKLIINQPL